MANYSTQFSCVFDVGSAENAARAADILQELKAALDEEDGSDIGFSMEHDPDTNPVALWIYSDENGEPEHVIQFVLRCAEAMNLTGVWGFTWGLSCSRPRLDAFGGGAHVVDLGKRETIDWVDCTTWLAERTASDVGETTSAVLDPMTGRGGGS